MGEPTFVEILLQSAKQDILAYCKLKTDPEIGDALLGFHAQQAIEKSLKAVLSSAGIAFRRTHDIVELMDLIADSSLPEPPNAERLDELNPYAVEMRYGLVQPGALDREGTHQVLDAVLNWAQETVGAQ
jgi:HEPN domain-containing protein